MDGRVKVGSIGSQFQPDVIGWRGLQNRAPLSAGARGKKPIDLWLNGTVRRQATRR
jgi:hypothetical protein